MIICPPLGIIIRPPCGMRLPTSEPLVSLVPCSCCSCALPMIAIAEVKAVLPQADPHNYDENGTYHAPVEEIPEHVRVAKPKGSNYTKSYVCRN